MTIVPRRIEDDGPVGVRRQVAGPQVAVQRDGHGGWGEVAEEEGYGSG